MIKYFISYKYCDYDIFGWDVIESEKEISSIDDIFKIQCEIIKRKKGETCTILNFIKLYNGE